MKKISEKQRNRDIRLGLKLRRIRASGRKKGKNKSHSWVATNEWIENKKNDLNIVITKKRHIILSLPEKMNFFNDYETTTKHIMAIRRLSTKGSPSSKAYRLRSVNFDSLRSISTSAALVLTAELSKWDDAIRQKLRPRVDNWDPDILQRFSDLGFFELFTKSNIINESESNPSSTDSIKLVKYIKGRCGDKAKTRLLKKEIIDIVGTKKIAKWAFLSGGLDEAITNVSHHAYPKYSNFSDGDKNWYLSGSYDSSSCELKVVFYDQGIGIPKSLPASEVWERILTFLSSFPIADRRKDEILLKAAVQLDRTSTEESDRGKGIQDMLEYIRQLNDGYLSILSSRGLYKFSLDKGKEKIKSENFINAIHGTLIIWSAKLL